MDNVLLSLEISKKRTTLLQHGLKKMAFRTNCIVTYCLVLGVNGLVHRAAKTKQFSLLTNLL